jgi:hypothetical protein
MDVEVGEYKSAHRMFGEAARSSSRWRRRLRFCHRELGKVLVSMDTCGSDREG